MEPVAVRVSRANVAYAGYADKVEVAILDDPGLLKPEYHIWISDKLSWVAPRDQLPQFPEWRTSAVDLPSP